MNRVLQHQSPLHPGLERIPFVLMLWFGCPGPRLVIAPGHGDGDTQKPLPRQADHLLGRTAPGRGGRAGLEACRSSTRGYPALSQPVFPSGTPLSLRIISEMVMKPPSDCWEARSARRPECKRACICWPRCPGGFTGRNVQTAVSLCGPALRGWRRRRMKLKRLGGEG